MSSENQLKSRIIQNPFWQGARIHSTFKRFVLTSFKKSFANCDEVHLCSRSRSVFDFLTFKNQKLRLKFTRNNNNNSGVVHAIVIPNGEPTFLADYINNTATPGKFSAAQHYANPYILLLLFILFPTSPYLTIFLSFFANVFLSFSRSAYFSPSLCFCLLLIFF